MRDPAGFLRSLPSWCESYIEPALAGDVEAAGALMVAAPNGDRGDVVKALWKLGVPTAALREAVQCGWDHDHAMMLIAFGRSLPRVFRAAEFPVDHLPDRFDIWRGGSGDWVQVGLGCSWTLDRDVACWFAIRWENPEPIVLRRTIERKHALAHITTRDEDEIVVWKVAPVTIDGDVDEWRSGLERIEATRRAK